MAQFSLPLPFQKNIIRRLCEFILKDNFFTFAVRIYRQRSGVAMGTRCAPNFTNLFMALLNEDLLQAGYAAGRTTPAIWLRCIDDILLVLEEDEQCLREFVARLKRFNADIQFTLDLSEHRITLLDLAIRKGEKFSRLSLLDFEPHRKSYHRNSYLRFDSCHPRSTFKSVVRGETIRLLRNSSNITTYLLHSTRLFQLFRDRSYPNKYINQ